MKNGICGRPGTILRETRTPDTVYSALGFISICSESSFPISLSLPALLTIIPAAVEIRIAGICVTRPSPIVRMVYVAAASDTAISFCRTPMISPPIILIAVMTRPATASPLTNLLAPSIAP